jgi:hypothetical protein
MCADQAIPATHLSIGGDLPANAFVTSQEALVAGIREFHQGASGWMSLIRIIPHGFFQSRLIG